MGLWNDPTSLDAFRLSWISLVITVIAAGIGIAYFVLSDSALMLCFGLENLVDFLSSAVVLWRFYCPSGEVDPVMEALLQKREKRASIAISFILALLGFGVMLAAVDDFEEKGDGEDEKWIRSIIIIAAVSFLIFLTLTVFKFRYGRLLHSASLIKDGMCSLIGTILSGSLLVNSFIIWRAEQAWFLDPIVAIACGLISLYVGARALVVACIQGIPIYKLQWWLMSQGDGMDEVTGRELTPDDLAVQPTTHEPDPLKNIETAEQQPTPPTPHITDSEDDPKSKVEDVELI